MDGKRKEEGLGWAIDGWSVETAAEELALLKVAARKGEGPTSLEEKRAIEKARKEEEERQKEEEEINSTTFEAFFNDSYLPIAKGNKKHDTVRTEMMYFEKWLKPSVGALPFAHISPFNLEQVKKTLLDSGRAPRTVQYCMAIFRQVWNSAKVAGLANGDSPSKSVKIPKFDNKRVRFLTHDEANLVLEATREKSRQLNDIALFALHTGARAKEIFTLKWRGIDFTNGVITLEDTKSRETRVVYLTSETEKMLNRIGPGAPDELVFKSRTGKEIKEVSNAFQGAVDGTGLNDGIEDRRNKVTFHTLRHTFASWHVISGTDIRVLQQLMGHHSVAMTMRYSHLSENACRVATRNFEKSISTNKNVKAVELAQE